MHREVTWQMLATRENYEQYLTTSASHGELVEQALELLDLELPEPLEEDLKSFFEEAETQELARFIALNKDPRDDREFIDFCKETAEEESDYYAALGLREEE
jgi:hypothetical protein